MVSVTKGAWESKQVLKTTKPQRMPESLRRLPWPPVDSIRKICRKYEVKCAGKYEPPSARGHKAKAKKSQSAKTPVYGHRFVFEMSREIQQEVESLEDILAEQNAQLLAMQHEVMRLQRSPSELPTKDIENQDDQVARHHNEIARIEQATSKFHQALKIHSDARIQRMEKEHAFRVSQLQEQIKDLKTDLEHANPSSFAIESMLKIQSLREEIARVEATVEKRCTLREEQLKRNFTEDSEKQERQHAKQVSKYAHALQSLEDQLLQTQAASDAKLSQLDTDLRNEKSKGNELLVENEYLKSRVQELNKAVARMQQLL